MSCPARNDRIVGGLFGLLIGDALGVPYEFHPPEAIPPSELIDFTPPSGFRRAHYGVPPGTWSDDGAQALILLDSLLANDGLDLRHFANGLRRWMLNGYFAVNSSVFDIGAQTSSAINRLSSGIPPEQSGPADERFNGNGSLMRVLPLALWHRGTDEDLIRLAMRQSLPTHGHLRSQVACAMYCLWARHVLDEVQAPWDIAAEKLRPLLIEPAYRAELELVLDPTHGRRPGGTGYVVDTLWSARQAFETTADYATCVRRAIAFGHDTDTTAVVAGGIAGIKYGVDGIPVQWRDALRGQSLVLPLLTHLLERSAG